MALSFIIDCDKDLDYIKDLEEKLQQESSRILNFFNLTELKDAKKN